MKKSTGRPPLGQAKKEQCCNGTFQQSSVRHHRRKGIARRHEQVGICKEGALKAEVIGVLSDEEKSLLHELKKLGPNLNQIAHHANAEGYRSVADKAEYLPDCIAKFILKLKNRMKS